MMATRSENLFLPPPIPQENWKEFMSELEGVSENFLESASPQSFLQLLSKATPPLNKLSLLRSLLNRRDPPNLSHAMLVGVITRKFHPVFFKKKLSADCCFFTVWIRDSTDEIRVSFWGDSIVRPNYGKLQEGRLVVIVGYKVKSLYLNDKYSTYETDRLSPAEATLLVSSRVMVIDLYSLWHARPSDHATKLFLREYSDFGFCPASFSSLSVTPSPCEFTRSVVARVIYKSSVRTCHSKQGELPCVWLALYDGSLTGEEEGTLGKEYVWLFLVFNFQINLFSRLKTNQLIVVTYVKAIYLFHEEWNLVSGYNLMLISTSSTQVYIMEEEVTSSAWHFLRSVVKQKSAELTSRAVTLSRRFRESAPEVTQSGNSNLFRQGNFECLIHYNN